MTQAVVDPSHHVLTSNAGNAQRYAEQLLARICRQWGVPIHHVRGSRHTGRRAGEDIVIKAITAEFLVAVEPLRMASYNPSTAIASERRSHLSHAELAAILGQAPRSIARHLRVIDRYRSSSLPDTARSQPGSADLSRPSNVGGHRMVDHDRASLEELVQGGGGA